MIISNFIRVSPFTSFSELSRLVFGSTLDIDYV